MAETLQKQEFAEQLPPSREFERSRKMTIQAAELAEATRAQLEAEVAAKNAELEEKGALGSAVEFETCEGFRQTAEGLSYSFYGLKGSHRLKQVSGKFNGLTVLDTKEATIDNKSGFRFDGIEPEQLVVCASIEVSEDPEARTFAPLRGIEVALMPPHREYWDDIARESLKGAGVDLPPPVAN